MQAPANQTEAFQMVEARFILAMSQEERNNNERLFSHIEQAWWFYEDAICDNFKHIPHIRKFEPFARQFVQWSPHFSQQEKDQFEENFRAYKDYQHRIPVHGAALLSPDLKMVLLVSGFGSHTWGFPKGKINQDEDAVDCALREVYEETGFDALQYFDGKRDYETMDWKHRTNGKDMHLLIIPNVPVDFEFGPRVVKEISDIRWFSIADLPLHEKSGVVVDAATGKREKVWGVSSFLPQLKEWISKRQQPKVKAIMKKKQKQLVAVQDIITPQKHELADMSPGAAEDGKFAINVARLRLAMAMQLYV